MTRKDFELIADILSTGKPYPCTRDVLHLADGTVHPWLYMVRCASARLRATNPRFDTVRFETACGLTGDLR